MSLAILPKYKPRQNFPLYSISSRAYTVYLAWFFTPCVVYIYDLGSPSGTLPMLFGPTYMCASSLIRTPLTEVGVRGVWKLKFSDS